MGDLLGSEAARRGIHVILGPTLNIKTDVFASSTITFLPFTLTVTSESDVPLGTRTVDRGRHSVSESSTN